MNTIALSICIPTYNRAPLLRENLNHLFRAVRGYEDCVEIIVSDNCSQDATSAVVASFQKELPKISYFRYSQEIHVDDHFLQLVSRASGEYVWLFGDDDRLEPNAIEQVIGALKTKPEVRFCNFAIFSKDMH